MRLLISVILLLSFLNACQTNGTRTENVQGFVNRDTTVTPQNAYTDLFLDSAAVARFFKSADDTLKAQVRNFYNARNYEFAWFSEDGITPQAEGFWNGHEDYINGVGDSSVHDPILHTIMDTLLYADNMFQPDRKTLMETEMRLTRHFFLFAQTAFGASADPAELQWHIPKRKLDIRAMLDSLLASENKEWQPLNPRFHHLQNAVLRYRSIQTNGGWPDLEVYSRKWRKGAKDEAVKNIKKRLAAEGHWPGADTSMQFTDSFAKAVAKVQGLYGQTQSGVVDAAFIKALNVLVEDRIAQMLVNLERMKWMPRQPDDYIFINIPEYRFRLIEGGREELTIDVVVGKAANRTVVFSDELKYIVFSPYWNIPRSIVRNEIVPAMRRSSSYLRRNNIEITGYSGDLPVVRQKPGRRNALGQVKFLFPNEYNIYFHDTPAKSLFSREKRAFSHGCIRLKRPFDLAKYLLKDDPSWTDAAIKKAMNRSSEKWVTLKKRWPVFITYFTSWSTDDGNVYFLEDIYGHDKKLGSRLFEDE